MKRYGFIFARGGSKGLPRKNIKKLDGKPLIQYSIEAALSSTLLDELFVSTDDQEIAEIAKSLGAVIINRPKELASDTSPEWLSWQHGINWVKDNYGEFDEFVSLPTTSPLRSVIDIDSAIKQRQKLNGDVCIAVTSTNHSPYFNMVKFNSDNLVEILQPEIGNFSRRQDVPEVFNVTTVVYVATPDFILQSDGIFSGRVCSIIVPKERAVDIDDIHDFEFAEYLLGKASC
jgi:CMP-N-acetylneuraminic acid synthetase